MAGDDAVSTDTGGPHAGAPDGSTDADPRLSSEYVRVVNPSDDTDPDRSDADELQSDANGTQSDADRTRSDADGGDVTLVGVVHDHPASTYRARTIAAEREPDVLALELPPLAVSLFERYADDEATPPAIGGEMSAAIQACDARRVAGIDGPSPGFGVRLARHLLAERPDLATVRTAVRRFAGATRHAIGCRLASARAAVSAELPDRSTPRDHAVSADDAPTAQASDERRQVRLARSVAAAFGAERAVATRDETREAHMASRLAALAETGDVVAVVGIDHVASVADRLNRDAA